MCIDANPLQGYHRGMIKSVVITDAAKKDLRTVPAHVSDKLEAWARAVAAYGLDEVRKVPGYHDEPLRGDRKGQRSIRLNKSYRAFYVISADGAVQFVAVIEVNNHKY